jgi:hypothetical protein
MQHEVLSNKSFFDGAFSTDTQVVDRLVLVEHRESNSVCTYVCICVARSRLEKQLRAPMRFIDEDGLETE